MIQENKRNKRLVRFLTLYRATSYDIIFFYPIQIIFLYQARGVSLAGNVLLESIFWLFNLVLLTASTKVVEKISARKATIIGSILWIISIGLYLLPKSEYYFQILIFAELVRALGLSLKSVADFPLVTETLHSNGLLDDKYYRQVEGNCLAINCAGDAVMAIISTSLMTINKDLPMWICLLSCMYGLILSYRLPENKNRHQNKKGEKISYKEILRNSKISKIIVHVMVIYGTFCYWESLGKDLLQEMEVSNISYGIIIFLLYVANSIGGTLAARGSIRKMFSKAKSFITTITIGNLILFVALGIIGQNKGYNIAVLLVAIILIVQAILKTSYIVEMKSLLQQDEKARIKIGNLLMSAEHLGKSIILAFASGIIGLKGVAICYIILFIVLIVPAICLSKRLEEI